MVSLEQPLLAVKQQKGRTPAIRYRPLRPGDFLAVKDAHAALFPIDYDDAFFHRATNAVDRIWSYAAFVDGPYADEQLVGFITAKTVFLHECEVTDRQHMGLLSPVVDHDLILYILTLGVVEGYRHQGIASALIQAVCQHAAETRCRAVFLHVITYNTAAMNLYSMHSFACVARLSRFYYIATGRQPDPSTSVYDAYLYVHYIAGGAGLATPWDMLTLAWSPLRSALGRIHSCMPGFCRQQQMHQYPASSAFPDSSTAAAANPSRSSSSNGSITSSYKQAVDLEQPLQQQQRQQQPPFGAPSFSRHWRKNAAGFGSSASGDGRADGFGKQHQQPIDLLPPMVQRGLQQQQQQQQQFQHLQQQPAVNHQQQHRPQRMLRWLFNGHSRPGLTRLNGQQQLQQRFVTTGQTDTQWQQQQQQQLQLHAVPA